LKIGLRHAAVITLLGPVAQGCVTFTSRLSAARTGVEPWRPAYSTRVTTASRLMP
jgi:hypothetical protein